MHPNVPKFCANLCQISYLYTFLRTQTCTLTLTQPKVPQCHEKRGMRNAPISTSHILNAWRHDHLLVNPLLTVRKKISLELCFDVGHRLVRIMITTLFSHLSNVTFSIASNLILLKA